MLINISLINYTEYVQGVRLHVIYSLLLLLLFDWFCFVNAFMINNGRQFSAKKGLHYIKRSNLECAKASHT